MNILEKMTDFFTARVDMYDEHMLETVEGCREGYLKLAELIPAAAKSLLDLGCGTGLELEAIWAGNPKISVTGIDLTRAMLERLKQKYPDRNVTLIEADYMVCDFGIGKYDTAVSFETLHHFSQTEKRGLYERIWRGLKPGGCYIECDYMAKTQEQEDWFFAEKKRLVKELGLEKGEYYHYDTPCTIDNQKRLLKESRFLDVKEIWTLDNTTILYAKR